MTSPTPSASVPTRGQDLGAARTPPDTRLQRLQTHWVYGGTLAALVLFALTPILTQGWPIADSLVWLTLPIYMLQQYEEHDADRFRLFVNDLTHGPGLSIADVFWINIIGVWLVLSVVIWLTRIVDPGWGVIAAWFLLINGIGHLVQATVLRRSNPGAWTAAIFFLPLGCGILFAQTATVGQHLTAVVVVVLLHAVIVARVGINLRRAR
jgi:Protein of unknown function with HXXEE motif